MRQKVATPVVESSVVVSQNFDPRIYVNKNMTVEDINKLKQIFDLFDYDHSGQISIEQINNTITALGLQKQAKNIITIVHNATSAEQLDFKTFINIFGQPQVQSQATFHQLYEVFDPDQTNCFGPKQFQKVCDLVGERFSQQEIIQMIDYADRDKDGGINFDEFVSTVTMHYPVV